MNTCQLPRNITCFPRDDLKTKLGSLPTKAILCAANGFLFSFVEDTLVACNADAKGLVRYDVGKILVSSLNLLPPSLVLAIFWVEERLT